MQARDAGEVQSHRAVVEPWGAALWRLCGGRKGGKTMRCLGHAEFRVAASPVSIGVTGWEKTGAHLALEREMDREWRV